MDTQQRLSYTSRRFLVALLRRHGPIDAPQVLRDMADELDGLYQWAMSEEEGKPGQGLALRKGGGRSPS